ncbi:MAG TPA: GTPase Era [Planctomycetota bacterium]|nr:GTPase Era [Planctomycetota bacterium]
MTDAAVPHRAGVVALVGRPNVGKSTLLNRLVGEKLAITSPKPQTTRHKVLGILTGPGYQALLLDTPGLMEKARDELDRRMLGRAEEALKESDVAALLVEPRPPEPADRDLAARVAAAARKVILAVNKIDTVPADARAAAVEAHAASGGFAETLALSALSGEGVDAFRDALVRHLPPGEPLYPADQVTDRDDRFLAAEALREKIYALYGEEIPYDTAVEIEEYREARPEEGKNKDYIRAVVYVNKESQKPILIGKGGQALKQLGAAARRDIEAILARPVFLEVWVKTRPRWRKDPGFLRHLGY